MRTLSRLRRRLSGLSTRLFAIHQMGKVASQTVEATLGLLAPHKNVMRTHFLHPDAIREFEALGRSAHDAHPETLDSIGSIRQQVAEAKQFLARLEAANPKDIVVLSGFRDPLDVKVSSFFQNLPLLLPKLGCDDRRIQTELEEAIGVFEDCFQLAQSPPSTSDEYRSRFIRILFRHPDQWIRREIVEYYGFDVLESSELAAPHVTFNTSKGKLIFYRYEDFRDNASRILREALGRKPRRLVERNLGEQKPYGALYNAFRSAYRPSRAIWDFYYRSEYFERLYSDRAPRFCAR